jgi:hypothetical protein
MDIVILKIFYVLLAFSVIVKCYIHSFLAFRNNLKNYGGGFSFKSLWFLKEKVATKDESLKRICNNMQAINMFF